MIDMVETKRDERGARGMPPGEGPGEVTLSVVGVTPVASSAQPVSVGVPFPRGVLWDEAAVSLSDPHGSRASTQAAVLARWPDRSVKWLLVDFLLDPAVADRGDWTLQWRRDDRARRARPAPRIGVEERDREIVVDTGAAVFRLDRRTLAPIDRIEIDGEAILGGSPMRTILTDARGRARRPVIERTEVEARGPVRATIRSEGTFEGRRRGRCRFGARLSFFAGTPLAHVELTVHNPRRARHRGGLWDLGDPGSIDFRDLSIELGVGGGGPDRVHWAVEVDGPEQTTEAELFEIYQASSGGENWRSRNHVNRRGQVPCSFRGYRVRRGSESSRGLRASPVVSARWSGGTITAAIPEFWQQFPKAIEARGGTLSLRFFPAQFGEPFELQGGEQKTGTAWLHFGRGDRPGVAPLRWVHRPARVRCEPEWYARTEVIACLSPGRPDPGDRYESFLSNVVAGPRSLAARREIIDEYGWRNYGEIYADHEAAYYRGEPPVISHYNNQYDPVNGFLIQYFRTGDGRWFDLADALARHVIDIDIYHATGDRAAYSGGLFWHTDHYRDAATSTHRAYSRANCGPVRSAYGGGPCNEHNYTTGLLHYYCLTGDPRAREAVLGLADWVIAMDDGSRTVLGLIDDGPTGLASGTTEPHYHGPGRGCGNSVNALIDGWLLTGSRAYLDKAEELIRRVVHPATDIPALDLLETELRWSYTVFLSVLSRHLDLKAEMGELDHMYAYGRACLLAFARWMLENERPYFDRPEKLEFPTETWAAQEFRKANVLRLAARHAGEPLRSRLIARGAELADRAWSDLLKFESRDVARSVALVMAEGWRDAHWRSHPIGIMPAPGGDFDFGSPRVFVTQKQRVRELSRTPRGAFGALAGFASVRNWRRFAARRGGCHD